MSLGGAGVGADCFPMLPCRMVRESDTLPGRSVVPQLRCTWRSATPIPTLDFSSPACLESGARLACPILFVEKKCTGQRDIVKSYTENKGRENAAFFPEIRTNNPIREKVTALSREKQWGLDLMKLSATPTPAPTNTHRHTRDAQAKLARARIPASRRLELLTRMKLP